MYRLYFFQNQVIFLIIKKNKLFLVGFIFNYFNGIKTMCFVQCVITQQKTLEIMSNSINVFDTWFLCLTLAIAFKILNVGYELYI